MNIKKCPTKLVLKGGTVVNPATGSSEQIDVFIKNGRIAALGKNTADANVVDCSGKVITAGFCDPHVHFREPGREDKETLATGARAALAGGYTRVCAMPNTNPPLDSPESIRFIVEKAANLPVYIHPIGALTRGQKGKEITEMVAMAEEGAVAFSDDGVPVADGQVFRLALEYARLTDRPVINHAEDPAIRKAGLINEGLISTRLGLPGNPVEAESVMVFRDIELCKLTSGHLHIPHVSTAVAADLIRNSKGDCKLTAEVTPHHLYFNDEALLSYDRNLKVAPPIRTEKDRQALIAALALGTIDCIATDHAPHTREEKEATFTNAPFGMIGLESAFGAVNKVLQEEAGMPLIDILRLFTVRPRQVMNFNIDPLQEGCPVEITVLDPEIEWTFRETDIASRSINSPFVGRRLKGQVVMTLSKGFMASRE
ncbi:MAG: dihydroorotase [FCB group bacterium]|nr:dihydroorotase [FCB group bacterium]